MQYHIDCIKLSNKYKVTLGLYVRLSPEYQRIKVDSASWPNWDEKTRQNHIMKFRQFKPSFSDEFERPSNAGRKPNFTPRLRVREAPQVLVDRQRGQRDEGIRISKKFLSLPNQILGDQQRCKTKIC